MADLDAFDEQDQSEVFDEDNTNDMDRGPGEEAEQFEDLVEVFDVTSAVGDDDDDDGLIGEDLDDDEIIALADDEDDADLEDDALAARDAESFSEEDDLTHVADADATDPDDLDRIARRSPDEVELEYAGDLNDLANAHSAAQRYESRVLSDEDLEELDYADGPDAAEGSEGGDARP